MKRKNIILDRKLEKKINQKGIKEESCSAINARLTLQHKKVMQKIFILCNA